MNRTWHLRIRKTHRYLGLFIGVQFLLWTLGGLYFSWSNLDNIHGDHLKRSAGAMPLSLSLASPSVSMQALRQQLSVDVPGTVSVMGVQLIDMLGTPIYQLTYRVAQSDGQTVIQTQLANALTGQLRNELSKVEATAVAQRQFTGSSAIEQVEYLTGTSGHHEYRQKPLPAYAVTFRQPAHATVYVAAQLGTVQTIRTDPWRIFDVLWMLHTMDYEGRDDINNGLLRAFSVLGLLAITSGFALYFISSPGLRRKPKVGRRSTIA